MDLQLRKVCCCAGSDAALSIAFRLLADPQATVKSKRARHCSDRKGCAHGFVLHCSLQAGSGKVFLQAREEGVASNIPCMGLLLGKYVPDSQQLRQSSWDGREPLLSSLLRLVLVSSWV